MKDKIIQEINSSNKKSRLYGLEKIYKLIEIGFKIITYMPPRNTLSQLLRLQGFCKKYELMGKNGVDINSPRQSFLLPYHFKTRVCSSMLVTF